MGVNTSNSITITNPKVESAIYHFSKKAKPTVGLEPTTFRLEVSVDTVRHFRLRRFGDIKTHNALPLRHAGRTNSSHFDKYYYIVNFEYELHCSLISGFYK